MGGGGVLERAESMAVVWSYPVSPAITLGEDARWILIPLRKEYVKIYKITFKDIFLILGLCSCNPVFTLMAEQNCVLYLRGEGSDPRGVGEGSGPPLPLE